MDQFDPKSWLCPKGHHSNSPQQHSDGSCWHKQDWLCQEDLSPMDHINSPQQQSDGAIWPKKLTVPYGSSYKQSTTTFWWTMLTQTGLTVPERPKAYGSSQEQSATTILWTNLTQKVDCALWVITRTVRNNNLMDQINPKSWLCPKGHHTNSPQQGCDGPFWHKQGWLCQKDLRPMGHHTNSPQQLSYGPNSPKKLTVSYGSSYKQSTTTIWWTILTQTVLTVQVSAFRVSALQLAWHFCWIAQFWHRHACALSWAAAAVSCIWAAAS